MITSGRIRRQADERGLALVEFAIVFVLFFTLLFGIIAFGVVLSFKQTMTQSASEASRAAAVTTDDPATATPPPGFFSADERLQAAETAIRDFNSYDRPCSTINANPVTGVSPNGMACTIVIHDCGATTDTSALPDCVTVTMDHDYASDPILPEVPLVAAFLPNTLTASSTSQISDPGP